MADPLGFVNGVRPANPLIPVKGQGGEQGEQGASFKDVLLENLREVNNAQAEATRAVEDLQTGQRSDVEGVILATQKADNAFRMLQSLRNRMMEAYDEVKQMRV
jgi:flagellar hook-basal body complex protein FliE